MKTDLSPAAEKALEAARTQSVVDELDLVRLLSALIIDDESLPAERLSAGGCRLQDLRDQLSLTPPLISYQRKFLTVARETATDHMEHTITGEYLLISLLKLEAKIRDLVSKAGGEIEGLLRHHVPEVLLTEEPKPVLPVEMARPIEIDALPIQRILDVNSNRVRESLRILDDYARFMRNDPRHTESIKNFRHEFVEILKAHPRLIDLAARDTTGDVGTAISTESEHRRIDVKDVAKTNVKRLQESLRSLEEFGKILDPLAAVKIEQLRYRSYTLERELFVDSLNRRRLQEARLYFLVTTAACRNGLEATVKGAIAGGVTIIQLREKTADDRVLLATAKAIRKWTRETNTLFIINDRPDVALMADADGVHLGQEDFEIGEVRGILPPEMLIGVSTHDPNQLNRAMAQGADYVGVGPTFQSTTKSFESFAGLEYVRHAMTHSTVPAFAIGGINLATVAEAVYAGASRIAVSAVISQAEDPEQVARQLIAALKQVG